MSVIDGNWKFDWQVFGVLVVDFELAARPLETGNDEADSAGDGPFQRGGKIRLGFSVFFFSLSPLPFGSELCYRAARKK